MRRPRVLLFLVLVSVFLLNGCVYYNTLYNAKKLYQSARSRPLVNDKPNPQSIDEYTKAIKKCGYILTEYKKSKYGDQALFLLAQCMFYKGNANLQTYEKCQDFLKFYPKSKLVPEVLLFQSIVLHAMNKNEEAVSTLTDFLQKPEYHKYYARAYIQLSIISMNDRAYAQAEYFLQKIIDNYPHSPEYKDAFFQLGYAYHLEKKYTQSNQVFQKLVRSHVEKTIKLDARYFIALNDYYLNDYRKVDADVKPLINAETRTDKIPLIQLLKARNLIGLGEHKKAVSLYEEIIKNNPRTSFSAEANYYLGEFYLHYQHDYEKAITYYNAVKTEFYASPYVDDAISKSAIAGQIIVYNKKDSKLPLQDMVNQQLKLAEYYLHNMDLPDSAVMVYKRIIAQRDDMKAQLDSLQIQRQILEKLVSASSDSLQGSMRDSTNVMNHDNARDSLSTLLPDKNQSIPGQEPTLTQSDTLKSNPITNESSEQTFLSPLGQSKADSTLAKGMNLADSLLSHQKTRPDTLEVKLLKEKEEQLSLNLLEYDLEFVPLALFDQVWVYKYSIPDSLKMSEAYTIMLRDYPLNRYTHAATLMMQDKEVLLTTQKDIDDEISYNEAMDIYQANPDSAKTVLKMLAGEDHSSFEDKAKFTLGYLYWFNEQDSVHAKPYFDELLKKDQTSDYSVFIQQFYNGKKFLFSDMQASFKAIEEKEQRKREAQAEEERKKKEMEQPVLNPQPQGTEHPYDLPMKLEVQGNQKDKKQQLSLPVPGSNTEQKLSQPPVEPIELPQPSDFYKPYDYRIPARR